MTESGQGMAETFATIARQLEAESSPDATQNRITRAAVATIAGCEHAAISIVRRRGAVDTVAATDDVPTVVDVIQYQTAEGPCLTAIYEHATHLIDDLPPTGTGLLSAAAWSPKPGALHAVVPAV